MKFVSRKAQRLAFRYTNLDYRSSRKDAYGLGIVHKPRWRQYINMTRRYRKFMYSQFGPITLGVGRYKHDRL